MTGASSALPPRMSAFECARLSCLPTKHSSSCRSVMTAPTPKNCGSVSSPFAGLADSCQMGGPHRGSGQQQHRAYSRLDRGVGSTATASGWQPRSVGVETPSWRATQMTRTCRQVFIIPM